MAKRSPYARLFYPIAFVVILMAIALAYVGYLRAPTLGPGDGILVQGAWENGPLGDEVVPANDVSSFATSMNIDNADGALKLKNP